MRSSWLWPLLIAASGIAIMMLVLRDMQSPARIFMAFWFLLVCPGMAFVRLLEIDDLLIEWTLAIGLSIALDTLVAGIMLYAGAYSFERTLLIIVFVSGIGVVLQIVSLLLDNNIYPQLPTVTRK